MRWSHFLLRRPVLARNSVFNSYLVEVNNQGSGSVQGVSAHPLFTSSLMHLELTVYFAEQGSRVMQSWFLICLLIYLPTQGAVFALPALGPTPVVAIKMPLVS